MLKGKYLFVSLFLMSSALVGCSSQPLEKPVYKTEINGSEIPNSDQNSEDTLSETGDISSNESSENPSFEESEPETSEPQKEPQIISNDTSTLSNEKLGWYFNPNNENVPPTASDKVDLAKYDAYYLGDTSRQVVYLTFDEGYENGHTSKILDVLKEKDVKAAFFVVKPYIESEPELIKRMVDEGHLVLNHSANHISSPSLSDEDFAKEIHEIEELFKELTGEDMVKIFRPPSGEYSERALALAQNLGYKTAFWSFAHKDWLVDDQPSVSDTYDIVMRRVHNGCVMLLHPVSSSNTQALPSIIDSLKEQGYTFETLDTIVTAD